MKALLEGLFKALMLLFFCSNLALAVSKPGFDDFYACWQKNKASMMTYEGLPAFVLEENKLAVVRTDEGRLNSFVKFDPFLNLYLVHTDFSLITSPTKDERELTRSDWLGILDDKQSFIGHLKYLANDIHEKDKLDFITKIGLLNGPCCKSLGISLSNGEFIGNRYLKHFAAYSDVYWGDIGVDFKVREGKFFVSHTRKNSRFWIGDEVLAIDGKSLGSLRELNESILFANRNSTLNFKILRNNEQIELSATVFDKDYNKAALLPKEAQKELAAIAITPKEPAKSYSSTAFGLSLNGVIIKGTKGSAAEAGAKKGDKILSVNGKPVKNREDIERLLEGKNSAEFLLSRKGEAFLSIAPNASTDGNFDFFLKLKRER